MDNATREALFAESVQVHMGIFLKIAHAFAESADREDLVQEMLLMVWQALPAFDGRCKLSTFIYRVANNRALNWRRSSNRYGRKLAALQHGQQLMMSPPEAEPDLTRLAWLYAVIRKLPPLDRTLLMLHLDRLSHTEITEVTGLSENNVSVRIHRIKQWLSKQKENNDGF
jgi:RNA polymerase sigma factor (sigma-70 family)